ncbi:DUF2391 family protein [Sphingomonas sp. OTU376]|uniref:DUF2391 family protein n=1 Tax=Sphingomonas sp. OTU376 TaxID=3043863 RepID=UPI00313D495B
MTSQAAKLKRDYAIGLARASAGAIIFGLPLLMTMEMWAIGLHIGPARLLLFMAFNLLVLVVLSRFGGFERTATLLEDVPSCGSGSSSLSDSGPAAAGTAGPVPVQAYFDGVSILTSASIFLVPPFSRLVPNNT